MKICQKKLVTSEKITKLKNEGEIMFVLIPILLPAVFFPQFSFYCPDNISKGAHDQRENEPWRNNPSRHGGQFCDLLNRKL